MTVFLIIINTALVVLVLFFLFKRGIHLSISKPVILLAFAGFIIAILLVFKQDSIIRDGRQRMMWPTTQARIIESNVIGSRAFRPDIVYEYEVDGQRYQSETNLNTPGFGNKRSRRDTAERISGEYPKDKTVTVYYDPDQPQVSFIRPGPQWSDYMKYTVGHFLFVISFFLFAGGILPKKLTTISKSP